MMTVSPSAVDIEHLRRTLGQLGYRENINGESAPLVHHILTDLNQATQQYTDLLQHYDELFARWQDEHTTNGKDSPTARGKDSATTNGKDSPTTLDLTHLSGLDSSMLETANNIDESFMLKTVEEARGKIDRLSAEMEQIKEENEILKNEKESMMTELQKSHMTAQELSQLLQSKHAHQEALQAELISLKKSTETGINFQLSSLNKTAISLLPNELQSAFMAKLSDSTDAMTSLLGEVLARLRREMEQRTNAINEAKVTAEKAKKDREAVEESTAKVKGLVTMYQGQIAELTSRLHQKDFEKTLQADIASQVATLEGYNNMIKEKLVILERLKQEGFNGATGEMAQMTVNTLVENLSAGLNTEVCFSSHLNQMIEKLNKRRMEQDQEINKLNDRIREMESKVAEAEMERTTLKSKMDKFTSDIVSRDGTAAASNEVIRNLQQALDTKQTKIDEQKKYCADLKMALEQCQAAMSNMRKNEEMIRQHVLTQDEEIKRSKASLTRVDAERIRATQRCTEMESELGMIKNAFKEKLDESQRLSAELKYAINSQERAQMELKAANDHVKELEDMLASKRKEKDLLMTTYCRVIKDNERLHADLQKIHEDFMATKAGDAHSESTMKAFQTKLQAQSQELENYRAQVGQAESKIAELTSKFDETQRSKRRIEEELNEKSREIGSLKGVVTSLERSKKDIAAQMARFGQQAADLRNHLRRIEEERADLQEKLKSSSSGDSPMARGLHGQLMNLSMELDQLRSKLRTVEREKDSQAHQLQLEKIKSSKMEEMMNQEKNKRLEKESLLENLETARGKIREELTMLNREHDKGIKSVRRQFMTAAQERSKSNRNLLNGDLFTDTDHLMPPDSPPDSPIADGGKLQSDTTEKLKVQNKLLKKHLTEIRNEMKQTLSPGKSLNPELESSIIALTSEEADDSSSPTSDEIVSSNAEIRRRLEHENKLLFKIVDKVRSELLKAGLETPRSISA